MPSVWNNMDTNSYDQLLIMKTLIKPNSQYSDDKTNSITEYLTETIK